jgi:hypothetical protein
MKLLNPVMNSITFLKRKRERQPSYSYINLMGIYYFLEETKNIITLK